MISSLHIDNKNKDILILGEGPTQGLHDTKLTAEDKYPINFTQPRKRFVLSCYIFFILLSYLYLAIILSKLVELFLF